jgi:hypothetical protein
MFQLIVPDDQAEPGGTDIPKRHIKNGMLKRLHFCQDFIWNGSEPEPKEGTLIEQRQDYDDLDLALIP